MKLQSQRRPDDFFLEQRRDVALLYPSLPVTGSLVQESLAQMRKRFLNRCAPREDKVLAPGECERLAAQVGKRNIGSEPQLAREPFKSDMVGTLYARRYLFGPPQPWLADDGNARCSFDRLYDSEQLSRTKRSVKVQEPRCEINHMEGSCRGSKRGLENVCVRNVALGSDLSICRPNSEMPSLFAVQKG